MTTRQKRADATIVTCEVAIGSDSIYFQGRIRTLRQRVNYVRADVSVCGTPTGSGARAGHVGLLRQSCARSGSTR